MKKTMILLATAATLLMFPSCRKVDGEGPVQTEVRAITDFSGVAAGIGGKINYTISPVFKVELIAQRNILDVLEITKINNYLQIKVKDGVRIKNSEDIVINICAPTADYLHLSGSGNLSVAGNLVSTNLSMGISGSGNIFMTSANIANKIDAVISGSGNIQVLAGTVKEASLRISGSGKLQLDGVAAEKATVNISGSGNMQVNTSQLLEATISGSGSVFYRGTPRVSASISGSGRVLPL